MKKFSSVLLKYEYDNHYFVFEEGKNAKDFMQTEFVTVHKGCPISVKIPNGVGIVTKLIKKDKILYMVENIGNVKDEIFGGIKALDVEISLGEVKKVRFYQKGKRVRRKLLNGKFTEHLGVGDAILIEVNK